MTSDDRKDVTRYLPNLWHSLVQVIIQSRLGEKAGTISKSPAKGSTMFNVEIKHYEDVSQHVKKFISTHGISLNADQSLSIEILLRTKDNLELVLEIWTLSIEANLDNSLQNICQLASDRMSVLLKSVICISRITPAYGLSFRQGSETFVILYRLHVKKPDYLCLGDHSVQVRVGQSSIQTASLSIHLAYRTDLTLPPVKQKNSLLDNNHQMMVKSDHFKAESSPKPPRVSAHKRAIDSSSEAAAPSDESQDALRLPFNSNSDIQSSSRSRTSSESSRGIQFYLSTEKLYIPFASPQPPSIEDFSCHEVVPFSNHLLANSHANQTVEAPSTATKENKDRRPSATDSPSQTWKEPTPARLTGSDSSNKSAVSNQTRDEDYVVVVKPPFAVNESTDGELKSFFREWQTAPPLHMFESDCAVLYEDAVGLQAQIDGFESFVGEYDDLLKSLNIDENDGE